MQIVEYSPGNGLDWEVLESRSGFAAIREEWDQLLEQNALDTPFLRWDYLDAAWGAFDFRYQPLIVVVRDGGGQLMGGLPLMTGRPEEGIRRHFRHLAFLGCYLCNDFELRDVLARRGEEETVAGRGGLAEALTGDLQREWNILCLAPSLESSVSMPLLRAALAERGLYFTPKVIPPSRHMEIAGGNLQPRSSKLRRNLNSLLRRIGEESLTVRIGGQDLPEEEVMSQVMQLHNERWDYEEEGKASSRFHLDVARRFSALDQTLMLLIEYEGKVAGGTYGLVYGDRYWGLIMGWLPEYRELSMGHLVVRAALERALELGVKEFDFLGGKGDYKQRWAGRERRLERYDAANHTTAGGIAFDALAGFREQGAPWRGKSNLKRTA